MDDRPPKKRKQQAMDTKQRIFDVAVVLIEEYGYDNVQIEDISRKAGVSMGLFYKYFANKADIISEILIQRCDQQYVRILETCLSGTRGRQKLIGFAKEVVEYQVFREAKADLSRSYANILLRENRIQFITSSKRPFYSIIDQGVEEFIEDEGLSNVEPRAISRNIIQMIRGAIFDYLLMNDSIPSQTVIDRVVDLVSCYLRGICEKYKN